MLAAVVWNYAEFAPMAQMMNETGFVVQGDGADEALVNTDASWKAFKDEGVEAIHYDREQHGRLFCGGARRARGRFPLPLGLGEA